MILLLLMYQHRKIVVSMIAFAMFFNIYNFLSKQEKLPPPFPMLRDFRITKTDQNISAAALEGTKNAQIIEIFKDKETNVNPEINKAMIEPTKKVVKGPKYILHWSWDRRNIFGLEHEVVENCDYNCLVTRDRYKRSIVDYDAIVFNAVKMSTKYLPKNRSIHQKYVFYAMDTPLKEKILCRDDFFNLTASYRSDSDIKIQNYTIKKQVTNYKISDHIFESKRKLVAWNVDYCTHRTTKYREKYIKDLQKYIPVDVYGRCGKWKCPKDCLDFLQKNYMFYISFEDSVCAEYVTDIYYEALKRNMIPIVLGGADYSKISPPHSYINILDYKKPKDLAKYLLTLSRQKNLYLRYFRWKKDYIVVNNNNFSCELCKRLHEPDTYNSIQNMKDWVLKKHGCFVPWRGKERVIPERRDNDVCHLRLA